MSAAGNARPGSAAGPVQQGLKEALIETLTAILSPVQEVRAAAEEQIKVLEVTEGEQWPVCQHFCQLFKWLALRCCYYMIAGASAWTNSWLPLSSGLSQC